MLRYKAPTPSKLPTYLYIFSIAFFARAMYSIMFPVPIAGDAKAYIALAQSISLGQFALDGAPTAMRPPLYPLALAALPDGTAFLFQAALGALTCVFIYMIARSWIPAILFAFSPESVYTSANLLTETLFTFLMVFAVLFWIRKRPYCAGLVFGLAALTRPIAFPILGLAFLLSLLLQFREYLKPVLIMLTVSVVVCLPWMIRNSIIEGRPTLTQRSALGTNLLYGTFTHEEFGPDIWTAALARYHLDNDEAETEALCRIAADPTMYLRARVEQYPRLFISTGDFLSTSYLVRIPYILLQMGIGLFAILGLRGQLLEIWITPLFLVLFHIPIWVETRYFLPAVPFICILAGAYLARSLGSMLSSTNNAAE